jgi:hypothetical protein
MIRLIYTFFVGLFLAVVIGTGIAVFYPSPKAPNEPIWLDRVEKTQLTEVEKTEETRYLEAERDYTQKLSVYNRNVSITSLGLAVATLAITFGFAGQLGVLADGLLLGGVFTLLYGMGRGFATDDNRYRFAVAAVGFIVTLILGYFKFTRRPDHVRRHPGTADR